MTGREIAGTESAEAPSSVNGSLSSSDLYKKSRINRGKAPYSRKIVQTHRTRASPQPGTCQTSACCVMSFWDDGPLREVGRHSWSLFEFNLGSSQYDPGSDGRDDEKIETPQKSSPITHKIRCAALGPTNVREHAASACKPLQTRTTTLVFYIECRHAIWRLFRCDTWWRPLRNWTVH